MADKMSWFGERLTDYYSGLSPAEYALAFRLSRMSMRDLRIHAEAAFRRVPNADGPFPLANHQKEAALAVAEHLADSKGQPTSIVVVPTAGGKTEIFARAVRELGVVAESCRRITPRTLLVVPTLELLDQTLRRLHATAPDLEIGVISGSEDRVCLSTAITYASMMRMIAAGELTPEDVDCVVLDEAHRALSDLRQELLTPFLGRAVFTAFTASPKFDNEKNIHSFLGAENEVYRATDLRLRDDKIIAPVVNYILKVDIKGTRPSDPELFSRFIDSTSARVFKEFLHDHDDLRIGQRLKDRLIFGFARSISHAKHTAELLNADPVQGMEPSETVSGKDRREDVADTIRRFGEGRISVLMNKWLLTEGIDVPTSGGVVSLAPTTSMVAQLQRGGRCRRRNFSLAADDPGQIAMVVDFCYSLNGKPLHPGQVFYCQAIEDLATARVVERPVVLIENVEEQVVAFADDMEDEEAKPDDIAIADPSSDVETTSEDPIETVKRNTGDGDDAEEDGDFPSDMSDVGLSISYDLDNVVYLISSVGRRIDIVNKTDEWLIGSQVASRLACTPDAFSAAWTALKKALENGEPPAWEGREFRFGIFRAGIPVFCLHRDDVDDFGRLTVERPSGYTRCDATVWLSRNALAEAVRCGPTAPKFTAIWDEIVNAEPRTTSIHTGTFVNPNGNGLVLCVHRGEIPAIEAMLGRPSQAEPKNINWISRVESASFIKLSPQHGLICEVWEKALDGKCDGMRFEFRKPNKGAPILCMHKDDLPVLAARTGGIAGDVGDKTEDWLAASEYGGFGMTAKVAEFKAAWAAMEQERQARRTVQHDGTPIRFELRRSFNRTVPCIHRDDLPTFRRRFDLDRMIGPKDENWINMNDIVLALSPKSTEKQSLRALFSALSDADDYELQIGGETVRAQWRSVARTRTFCIPRPSLAAVGKELGLAHKLVEWPEKTAEWLIRHECATHIGMNGNNVALNVLWDEYAAECEAGRPTTTRFGTIRMERRRSGKFTIPMLHKDDVGTIATALGRVMSNYPARAPDEASLVAVARKLGSRKPDADLRRLWSKLEAACLSGEHNVTLSGETFDVFMRRLLVGDGVCIPDDQIEAVERVLARDVEDGHEFSAAM